MKETLKRIGLGLAGLLAGDFLYQAGEDPSEEIRKAVEIVRPLSAAGIPTFAVLGNHDYSLDVKDGQKDERQAARLAAALREVPAGTPSWSWLCTVAEDRDLYPHPRGKTRQAPRGPCPRTPSSAA